MLQPEHIYKTCIDSTLTATVYLQFTWELSDLCFTGNFAKTRIPVHDFISI